MRRNLSIALVILMALMLTACPKTPQEKESLKRQAIVNTDRLAQSIKLATGITRDLYEHKKISRETAEKWATVLQRANTLGKQLGEKVKDLDVNAVSLPTDLTSVLDEIDSLLKSFGVGNQYVELARSIGDAIQAVNNLRRLING